MPRISVNNVELAYDLHGSAGAPVILLIMGLGLPQTAWPPRLIELLVAEGFRILTFDNRDTGRSQYFDHVTTPSVFVQAFRHFLRLPVNSAYRLTDMMRDTTGLLDALDIPSAHVVGVSMGGMIAQLMAIHEPEKVGTLTTIMSTTGNRSLPGAAPAVAKLLAQGPASPAEEDRFAYHRQLRKLIGSPDYPPTEEEVEAFMRRTFDRGMTASGTARQLLAVMAAGSRVSQLRQLDVPSIVIHGDADPLIPVECGRDIANSIPGARMTVFPGMGHDLPKALLPEFSRLIGQHARSAQAWS